jgi:2-amino-4-hydroxy-6-hydroxymethyldihydropteridine diphosphokinase / dihydropteroate synthase
VETSLEPIALLNELQNIENSMGRKKIIDKGPRNIDLDILLYEDVALNHERLKLPHPGIAEREFVLRPLAEYVS